MVEGALGPKYPDLILNSLNLPDGEIGVRLKPNIILNFSDAIDPLTVTVNLNSPACVGSVQLSKTNFVTCEQLVPPIISSAENNSFTIFYHLIWTNSLIIKSKLQNKFMIL